MATRTGPRTEYEILGPSCYDLLISFKYKNREFDARLVAEVFGVPVAKTLFPDMFGQYFGPGSLKRPIRYEVRTYTYG